MKRKWGTLVAITCAGMLVLNGCSSASTNSGSAAEEIHYADDDFMESLAKGLEARWALNATYEETYGNDGALIGSDDMVKAYTSWAQVELDEVAEYADATFENKKLQEKAISYINCLNDQIESMDYAKADVEKWYEKWNAAYNERSKLIEDFVNDYGLTVSEKYESTLKDMLDNSSSVKEDEAEREAVNAIIDGITFEDSEDEGDGWKTYSAVIENTSNMDFSDYQVVINLIDADGVIVSEEYASVSNFKRGQKAKLTFSTDQKFSSTEIAVDYWQKQ